MASSTRRTLLHSMCDLPFEAHDIRGQIDASGHYTLPFSREFPLSVRLFHYRAGRFTLGVTWHEQLELFCPIDGAVDVKMGDQMVHLKSGDLSSWTISSSTTSLTAVNSMRA